MVCHRFARFFIMYEMSGFSIQRPVEHNSNTREKVDNCKTSTRFCRHRHKVIICHRSSILIFMCITLLALQRIGASTAPQKLHENLFDVQEFLSRIKERHEDVEGSPLEKLRFSQDNLAHGFHEQEVTIPMKIHHMTGQPTHNGHHFLRKRLSKNYDVSDGDSSGRVRRSASSSSDHETEINADNPSSVANFSITAFGEEFRLHLSPYSKFISPTFTLHVKGNATHDVNEILEDVPRHCFYTGTVNSTPGYSAVLSLCGGMFGVFRMGEMDYIIEPHDLTKFSNPRDLGPEHANEETGTKLHRIYRRSAQRAAKKTSEVCAFADSKDIRKRRHDGGLPSTNGDHDSEVELLAQDRTRISLRKLKAAWLSQRHYRRLAFLAKANDANTTKLIQNRAFSASDYVASKRILRALKMDQTQRTTSRRERSNDNTRQKRYVSYPRHVEVMVTAGNGMLRAHRANLQHYILTLMAIVHHIYLDPSIGNQINIIFVKLIVIDDDSVNRGPHISQNAHECLRNFCQWQADENDPDDSHPNHHDTAVLITRQDICRSRSACDTLGLAELGTMCDPLRSCSINEDNGLSTAFTIAHELGHEFNAPHDNNEKCSTASGKPEGMHVMSPTLDHKSKPWSWSSCSARYITNFLDYGNGQCLLDEPPQRKLPLPIEEPGQIYDVNQQCSFVYGKGVTHCGFMTTCARLWCVSADRRHGCRTPHMPWADGTKCAPGKWCQRGQCVPEIHSREAMDGGWGEWSKFGECSRSCSGGVRIAQRECNSPSPRNGGRYCVGKRKKFRSCNWEDCKEPRDFRAEQCKSYSWSKYKHHLIKGLSGNAEWIPKYDGILLQDRCKLICQVKREDQYGAPWYVLKPKVINGTPCGPDTNDICVEGICKRAGCDHVLNSNTKLDDCGVCGGDNSGCRTVKGVYNHAEREGYNIVVEIPARSTNVLVEQRSYGYGTEDNNYLALKDSMGKFILNGNRNIVQFEQTVEKPSSTGVGYTYQFDYTGSDNLVERINSTRAILENITVLVLSAGSLLPPNIKYRYHIPLPEQITYSWDPYGPWNECSHQCRGQTRRKVMCVRSGDGQTVADHKCHTSNKPPSIVRSCNMHCEIKWRIKSQECSARCGKGILRYKHECIKLTPRGRDSEVEILHDLQCRTPKPEATSVCYGSCLPTSWRYGNWSQCNRKCGGGIQRREAACKDSRGVLNPSSECDVRSRLVSRMCNVFACPQWVTRDFSKCLATCGTGIRRRNVWCRVPGGQVQNDSVCDPLRKPPSTIVCHLAPCPTWEYEDWGKCSVTCGEGVTTRIFRCTDYLGRHVDGEQCNEGLRKKDIKACFMAECFLPSFVPSPRSGRPTVIHRGPPFIVPVTSDQAGFDGEENLQSRRISVANRMQNDGSSILPREIEMTDDKVVKSVAVPTDAEWRMGHWTDCTASCDGGMRQRYVSCRDFMGFAVNDIRCNYGTRPVTTEPCNTNPCPGIWRTGAWSECSATCGDGMKTRYVRCMYSGRYDDSEESCDSGTKPVVELPCATVRCMGVEKVEESNTIVPEMRHFEEGEESAPAPSRKTSIGVWRTGPWSQCSSSCGSGSRKRAVVCHGNCESLPAPPALELCDAGPCPRWRSGGWSSCSVSCDRGVSTRTVQCIIGDGIVTSDTRCDIMRRPSEATPCGSTRCSDRSQYRWRSSAWSGCSATCGRGLKTRQVTCVNAEKSPVVDEMCSSVRRKKPSTIRKCRTRRRCPRWHAGKWNKCSVTCGSGFRVRSVTCRYKRKSISDDMCDTRTKPENVETCDGTECDVYSWTTSTWSTCSVSCGWGVFRRLVACVNGHGIPSTDSRCPVELKPIVEQRCQQDPCNTFWQVEAWSECSSTCGEGTEHRTVRCLYVHRRNQTLHKASNCNETSRPPSTRACHHNTCESEVLWRVGPWNECSVSCGLGLFERQVACFSRISGREIESSHCEAFAGPAPNTTAPCSLAPCVPASCRHAQIQFQTKSDGEYLLQIHGVAVQLYCKGMHSRHPSEYLTLPAGKDENFSEIYRFSLNNSETCPHNGSRNNHCACTSYPQSGKTTFTKIRFDIRSMKVIINDFSFSSFEYGRPVPFAVGGDCYSKAGCPQGQFRIDLSGTGLSVDSATTWSSYGRSAVQRIKKSLDGRSVSGQCGGYCGHCRPDLIRGLRLTHFPES